MHPQPLRHDATKEIANQITKNTHRMRKKKKPRNHSNPTLPEPTQSVDHPPASITIDGSRGEGGGQILRMSLALSSVLSRSVRIDNIRAGRSKPGLLAQHLTGADLVARIAAVPLVGGFQSSTTLSLGDAAENPSPALPLRAEVGTAGAVALVLQAALPAALRFLPSLNVLLTISGGTTALFAPGSDYVNNVFIPNLRHFGISLTYKVLRHGFFPKGGGLCELAVDKSACDKVLYSENNFRYVLPTCNLTTRGHITSIKGNVLVCGEKYVRAQVAIAMRTRARQVVRKFCRSESGYPDVTEDDIAIKVLTDREGSGECVAITLWATTSEDTVLGGSSIWSQRDAKKFASDLGLNPPRNGAHLDEKVKFWQETASHAGEQAAEELCEALRSGAAVDSYMADQLCIFMAMSSGTCRLLVPPPTLHLTSVVDVFQSFGIEIQIEDVPASPNKVVVCEGKAVTLCA